MRKLRHREVKQDGQGQKKNPIQAFGSRALTFNHCVILSLNPMKNPRMRLPMKVTPCCLMSIITGMDSQ